MTLDLALSYATDTDGKPGVPIFPCRPGDEADPETGEIRDEKSPYTSNGLRGATTTRRIIERWWADNPAALVGIPTGARAGFFVLDLDVKPDADGHDWLRDREEEYGELPATRHVRTANGGTHVFFNHVDGVRNRGTLGPAVDIRGEGGYIIGAGSVMTDGRAYTVIDDSPIADAPDWLLELVLPKPAKATSTTPYAGAPQTNDAYVDSAVDQELRQLAGTGQGGRGYALNASAFNLGQFVASGALAQADAEAGLYAAAVSNGLLATDGEREVWAKIRRGIAAGARSPRQIPAPGNDNTRLVDIRRMIANGLAKREEPANDVARQDGPPVAEANDNDQGHPEADSADDAPQDAITATPFEWIDPKTLPRREFVYGAHLIRKYVSVTVAPGGIGKSNLINAECLAMASGKALLGTKPVKRMRCWIFNAEDPRDELDRRLMATCLHYKLSPEDVAGHLFLDTGREQELCVAVDDKKAGIKYIEPVIEAIVAQIKRHQIDVMIVDPFVSTHSVNENDNGAIDKVAKLWAHIADETNCAIDIVHHLRKVSDREATVEDARGAVSLIGAARSVRVLNRMSADQAKEAGIPDKERFSIFGVNYGKSNLTPVSASVDWRRLVSVPLGNGRGLSKPQDHAPAVTEWHWPTKEAIVEAIPADVAELVCTRLRNGDFVQNYQSTEWAGIPVADIMGVQLPSGKRKSDEHRKVERLIDGWLEAGMLCLREEPAKDPRHPDRRTVFVRAA